MAAPSKPPGYPLFLPFALALSLVVVAFSGQALAEKPVQPIRFNHQKHTQEFGLNCSFCHQYVETRQVAGKPAITICAGCHLEMDSALPEAQKVTAASKKGVTPPWVQVTRLASHVRFSHMRHVGAAKLSCTYCHGEVAKTTSPIEAPLVKMDMNFCLDCHTRPAFQLDLKRVAGLSLGLKAVAIAKEIGDARFYSVEDLKARVEAITGDPLEEDQTADWMAATQKAEPVVNDCMGCHR